MRIAKEIAKAEDLLEEWMTDEEQKMHSYEVMYEVMKVAPSGCVVPSMQMALCHDLLEDSCCPHDEIDRRVSSVVAEVVERLTQGGNESYVHYLKRLDEGFELVVKIADLRANINRIKRRLSNNELSPKHNTMNELKYSLSRKEVALAWLEDRFWGDK